MLYDSFYWRHHLELHYPDYQHRRSVTDLHVGVWAHARITADSHLNTMIYSQWTWAALYHYHCDPKFNLVDPEKTCVSLTVASCLVLLYDLARSN